MHGDYVYPSVYFVYFLFSLLTGGAAYFLARSWRDGYWGPHGEDVKYDVFEELPEELGQAVRPAQRTPHATQN